MTARDRRSLEYDGVAATTTAAMVLALGLLTWLAPTVMRHFEGAIVPWPAHGLALATLLVVRPAERVRVAVMIVVAIALGGLLRGGFTGRPFVAAAQLTAQSILIALLHQRLGGGAHPLGSVLAYAKLGVAVVVGIIPTTLLAAALAPNLDPSIRGGFTFLGWWQSGVSSMAIFTPILLAPTTPSVPGAALPSPRRFEFPALAIVYSVALLFAFFTTAANRITLPAAVATVPFLVWAGLRFGVRGYAVFAALLATAAIGSTLTELGPFAIFGDALARGQRAWVYVASLAGPTMIFPVALAERAAAEARMRAAFAQLTAIIESSREMLAALDRDMAIIAVNPAWVDEFERFSGVRVKPGMHMDEVLDAIPQDKEESLRHWRRALAGEQFTAMRVIGNPDRLREEFEISYSPVRDEGGAIVGASQIVRNASRRRLQESAEASARRLEALGRLAGGVAHDFNNLMTSVIGYTDLISQSLPTDDERQADLSVIMHAAQRAGQLTQQLLAFARRQVVDPRDVDVGSLVTDFTRLLGPLLGSAVRLEVRIQPSLPKVRIDPAQFEQVLMNLAVNARDAMPAGGDLTVEVAPAEILERHGVRLSVRDSGHGMSAEVLERIWEPFYTTKPAGQGTGLGLATVHGIVHQAGGDITVQSEAGRGTTFHVFLPAADSPDLSAVNGPGAGAAPA